MAIYFSLLGILFGSFQDLPFFHHTIFFYWELNALSFIFNSFTCFCITFFLSCYLKILGVLILLFAIFADSHSCWTQVSYVLKFFFRHELIFRRVYFSLDVFPSVQIKHISNGVIQPPYPANVLLFLVFPPFIMLLFIHPGVLAPSISLSNFFSKFSFF